MKNKKTNQHRMRIQRNLKDNISICSDCRIDFISESLDDYLCSDCKKLLNNLVGIEQ